ncbi:MAG TPA: ABC transporter permease, partial [Pyrinomonadaceae bacterium]
ARVTAFAAIISIAMGVAALIVAFALSNGFRNEMRDKILQGTAHVSIFRSDGLPVADYESVSNRVRQVNGVVDASPTTYDGALANGPTGSTYVVLRGVDVRSGRATLPSRWIREGSFEALFESKVDDPIPHAVVGSELATRLGVKTGETIQVLMPNAVNSSRRLKVAGIFSSGLFEFDSTWIYLPLETASAFAGASHAATVVSVQVANVDDVKRVAAEIRSNLGSDFRTIDWQDANQPLFSALALERRMGLFIIGLIIAIAVINITTMLILVVVERRRDIAILNALGATRPSVMALFLIEGGVVGAAGAMCGVVVGVLVCSIGNHFKLVSLPADVYSISNVPLTTGVKEVVLSALVAFALSLLATIYPALVASRMRPAETLRDA